MDTIRNERSRVINTLYNLESKTLLSSIPTYMSEVLKLDISAVSNLHPLTSIPTYMSGVLKLDISAICNLHPPHQHSHIHEWGP